MKIFITGTTGFLGRSLKEHFESSHNIDEYVRGSDITGALDASRPDLIIHCAGEIYNTELMFSTNVIMMLQILEWIRSNPATRLIQIGSSSEYGPVGRATSEQDRINPQNIYEATKGSATLLCQAYARQYGLQTCVARIYSGYGVHERERRLFPTLYRAFFNDEPMQLYDGVHDFIYIADFVRGIELLLNKEWPPGEIVNFGTGVQYRNITVLKIWEAVLGRTAPVTYENRFLRAHDTRFWSCDPAYAKKAYGFVAEYELKAGIEDFIKRKHELTNQTNN
jgi:nucleoside-diphosphate-sugar epimerase